MFGQEDSVPVLDGLVLASTSGGLRRGDCIAFGHRTKTDEWQHEFWEFGVFPCLQHLSPLKRVTGVLKARGMGCICSYCFTGFAVGRQGLTISKVWWSRNGQYISVHISMGCEVSRSLACVTWQVGGSSKRNALQRSQRSTRQCTCRSILAQYGTEKRNDTDIICTLYI